MYIKYWDPLFKGLFLWEMTGGEFLANSKDCLKFTFIWIIVDIFLEESQK